MIRLAAGSPAHAGMHPTWTGVSDAQTGLPRARGDAPTCLGSSVLATLAPPRTRGCTLLRGDGQRRMVGSPAHAGMHPTAALGVQECPRLPRARGDAPVAAWQRIACTAAPPRTRGCTPWLAPESRTVQGSPAHAGMHPRLPPRSPLPHRLPRARGDAPWAKTFLAGLKGAPPRTRGCTLHAAEVRSRHQGSPAHAGMHPTEAAAQESNTGLPRARGDAPAGSCSPRASASAPPRTRGCTQLRSLEGALRVGSPAHAGMHPPTRTHGSRCTGLPRARGDAPNQEHCSPDHGRAPPRTRGCTHAAVVVHARL